MNQPPSPTSTNEIPDRRFLTIAAAILSVTVAADFLFWYETPGVSLAIFVVVLAITIFANAPKRWSNGALLAAALLFGAAAQSAVEISFSNILVILVLLVVLMGEEFFASLPAGWPRWSEAVWSSVKTPARWLRLLAILSQRRGLDAAGAAVSATARVARALRVCLPALVLTGLFALVLGSGNAIFGSWIHHAFDSLLGWLVHLDITIGRLFFWFLVAGAAMPFVQPASAPDHARWWTRTFPMLPEPRDHKISLWQSRLVLLLINALFFAVNTIDAIYLWVNHKLPDDVSYSSFVHRGVFLLVLAVLLAAAVLVALFQQADPIARDRTVRVLALIWIAQNIVLVGSVLLRLKLYVEAYQLSTLRVYVALFLLLVTVGFVLLAIHVQRRRTLNWLVFTNALATFVLFYIVQLTDVAKFVARYNVTQWKTDRSHPLDLNYLESLGPSAWPALAEVACAGESADAYFARQKREALAEKEKRKRAGLDWRSWQARRAHYDRELLAKPLR